MLRSLMLAVCLTVGLAGAPRPADAQIRIMDRVRERAKARLDSTRQKTEDHVVEATGTVVDSAAAKTGRGVDTVVTKSTNVVGTVVDRTSDVVAGMVKRGGPDAELARQFATGRVVLAGVRFTPDDAVARGSESTFRALAKLLASAQGPYVVQASATDAAAAGRRARAVKASLVAAGVDASRLFALGQSVGDAAAERVELARMQ